MADIGKVIMRWLAATVAGGLAVVITIALTILKRNHLKQHDSTSYPEKHHATRLRTHSN